MRSSNLAKIAAGLVCGSMLALAGPAGAAPPPTTAATPAAAAAPAGEVEQLKKRLAETEDVVEEMEQRLDKVEKKSVVDRVNIGLDYRTVFNFFAYKGPSPDPYDIDASGRTRRVERTTREVWSHRVRLAMWAEPISSLRVSARLVMFKHYGDADEPAFVGDNLATRIPRGSGARIDQAWLDWFLTDWLTLSMGRMSYTDVNPPGELRENSRRQATWGLQMVDGEYETISLTFNLSKLADQAYIRAFYTSWYNDNDDIFGNFPFLDSGVDNIRLVGFNLDVKLPRFGKTFLQLGYFAVPHFRPFNAPISDPAFDARADYRNAPATADGSLLWPSELPDSMGSMHNISGQLEALDVMGSGLDIFFAGSLSLLGPGSDAIAYNLPENAADPTSARRSTPLLYLASKGDSNIAYFLYGGLRYSLPFGVRPKIGFEVNHGSRYHISFATPTDRLLTKLATRGQAYEAYLLWPFNRFLFLRIGYLMVNNRYQQGFFGPDPALYGSTAPEVDQTIHNGYLLLNASI